MRPDPPRGVAFAHASEAELARILDFYGVAWEYEPHAFPLMWNLRGEVVESFTPDFFLPELDLHLELTTLRQKLVRKKNRKLRRMRELYPDVRVKLLYGKDFRALLLKFGRIGLADALSGTVGQTTPPRASEPVESPADEPATDASPEDGRSGTDRPSHPSVKPVRSSRTRRGGGRGSARRSTGRAPAPTGTGGAPAGLGPSTAPAREPRDAA